MCCFGEKFKTRGIFIDHSYLGKKALFTAAFDMPSLTDADLEKVKTVIEGQFVFWIAWIVKNFNFWIKKIKPLRTPVTTAHKRVPFGNTLNPVETISKKHKKKSKNNTISNLTKPDEFKTHHSLTQVLMRWCRVRDSRAFTS